jgi:hypothetical protein
MDAALVVAAIIGVFFLVGLVVGGIIVIALPLFRGRRSGRDKRRGPGDGPFPRKFERGDPDDRPRWPGDDDDS